jgi:hypothetical protein
VKLIAIGLAAHCINERVASHFPAALQFRIDTVARRVDPEMYHFFRAARRRWLFVSARPGSMCPNASHMSFMNHHDIC